MNHIECPFCNIPKEDIFLENEYAVAIFDKFPVSKGHVLIVTKRHAKTFFDLEYIEKLAVFKLLERVEKKLDVLYLPDGYNVGFNVGTAAGQTVPHFHLHVIPRYNGDVEDPRGGIRGVIPEKKLY